MVVEHIHAMHTSATKIANAVPDNIWTVLVKYAYWIFVGSLISLVSGRFIRKTRKKA